MCLLCAKCGSKCHIYNIYYMYMVSPSCLYSAANINTWWKVLKLNLHRFQMYNFVVQHLYTALCVHHPTSSLIPSLHIRRPLPVSSFLCLSSPLVTAVLVFVSMTSLCLLSKKARYRATQCKIFPSL